jgi:hypothetical protein
MANKTITLTVSQGNSRITFTDTVSDCSPWMAQSYLFHKFLLAQGYHLDAEQVGADVEDYINAEVPEEY